MVKLGSEDGSKGSDSTCREKCVAKNYKRGEEGGKTA